MQPKPPDPAKLASEQTKSNRDTAITQYGLGATNQVTPGGSLTYRQIGTWSDGTPRYEATTTLSPEMQGIYGSLMGAAGNAAGNINNPIVAPSLETSLDTSGLSALPTQGDYSTDRLRVEDAISARLNPQLASARGQREQDLFNRGVRPGTEAYDRAMGLVGQQENDARLQTILAGGQEQSRMFSDALAGRSQGFNELLQGGLFGNNAALQGFQSLLAARNQPINEISALMSGAQVNQPNFVNTPQPGVAGTDVAGIYNNAYQQQVQRQQNIMSGLFGLGSTIAGIFSDERLKEDIRRVGETDDGLPIYTYRYKGDDRTQMGVLAHEAMAFRPEAVGLDESGYLTVNYGAL